jgi:hypothetical protein
MAKKLNRRKPGYTKNGEVKIISLSVRQLTELREKTQATKKQAKIQRRMNLLTHRGQVPKPVAVVEQTTAE